ncbi:MAG: RNA methyltransferase [Bacteroidaceae bacterium]|nr:RNA methyltransferase [Bacteroidaceae bacterium]
MMGEFEMIAKTFQGLEEVLAKELVALGANNVQIGRRMVSFTGDKAMMYKANFHLRTAVRILKPFLHFKATNADEVYEAVKAFDWEQYLDTTSTFSVDAVVYSEVFRHSKFVAYRVKDAIADYFNDKYGERPSVRLNNPDLIFHIHIAGEDYTLAFDSSGESLHRRGYRVETGRAPINEVLAAGMIMLTNWHGECDFIDPMCGSGTLPIEAALIARNIAPGVFRQGYAFEKWKDYDSALFKSIYEDDSAEREFKHKIYGYDVDGRMVACARRNVKSAMMNECIEIECRDIKDFEEHPEPAIMIVNPPYGERLVPEKLLQVYKDLGARLKHAFQGNVAWVISNNYDCFDQIGLKASARIPLYNGDLDCEFRKYELFQGKYKGFRNEGNELKKDFSPLKRKSRLTGLDGELRPERKAKSVNNDANYSSEIDDESMRRRRELEAYFNKARRKPARRERGEGDGERTERREGFALRDERRAPRENRRDDRFASREARGERRVPRENRRDDRFAPRDNRDERRAPREGGKYAGKGGFEGRKPFDRKGDGKRQSPYKNDFKPLRGGKRDKK